ncbi:unnamed protein product [Pedinophyceae sp. YPF-701]|nr:unnamed protein product [Pedinophyceae sp. YPF-701]
MGRKTRPTRAGLGTVASAVEPSSAGPSRGGPAGAAALAQKKGEETAITRAQELVQWSREHEGRTPREMACCRGARKATATPEELHEHQFGQWLANQRMALNGKGRHKSHRAAVAVLDAHFGRSWRAAGSAAAREEAAIRRAEELVQWAKDNPARGLPQQVWFLQSDRRAIATEAELQEHELAKWLSNQRRARNGKGRHKSYPGVVKVLDDHFGERWHKAQNSVCGRP